MKTKTFPEALIHALKNPTRAAIFYQLLRRPNSTATEIAKRLGEDFDVVHYHLKQLRKIKLVKEPKIVVKRNYIEKQYSLISDFKERLLESLKPLVAKEKELSPEDSRNLLTALLTVVRSIITESMKRIETTPDDAINRIMSEDIIETKIVFCSKEDYLQLLEKLREVLGEFVLKTFDPVEKQYTIAVIAIPKLD